LGAIGEEDHLDARDRLREFMRRRLLGLDTTPLRLPPRNHHIVDEYARRMEAQLRREREKLNRPTAGDDQEGGP
jgi:hypothetical protein